MSKTKVELNGKNILVTGSPGFIGANLVMRLLKELSSGTVLSFDVMNDYYDVELKKYRLREIEKVAEKSAVKHVFVKGIWLIRKHGMECLLNTNLQLWLISQLKLE